MTDETPEQIAVRVQGEHVAIDGFMHNELWRNYACGCGWWSTADDEQSFRVHVAAELTAELRAGGWLVEGETEVEWGVRLVGEERIYAAPNEKRAKESASANWRPMEVVRRTRYLGHVTEWQPVEDGA